MRRAWVGVAIGLGAASPGRPVAQQQASRAIPFNGQFGALEIASQPREAARLAKLMGDALDGLAPQRPGQLDVYLITASLWGDPVFEREATQAEAILREHFDADGRSIILSAGGQGERRYPAATPDNISAAIGQVGSIIDPNEDLVVVFITSHGAPDGDGRDPRKQPPDGRPAPAHMRDMLSQAGIRNRVVIVSACFSGRIHRAADGRKHDRADSRRAGPHVVRLPALSAIGRFSAMPISITRVRGGASLVPAFDEAQSADRALGA